MGYACRIEARGVPSGLPPPYMTVMERDSSDSHFCVGRTHCDKEAVFENWKWLERWRFSGQFLPPPTTGGPQEIPEGAEFTRGIEVTGEGEWGGETIPPKPTG